ncbi:hypothetical protein Taro_051114, partial [Colocasia esculenta]|nr:hypothetical protein [Colocasia esculenta]
MASGSGSHSGSRPRRQRITLQQNAPTLSGPLSSAATSTVGSTSSIAGPVSSQAWGQGHRRRGPSRGVTDGRLEIGQQWNVQVVVMGKDRSSRVRCGGSRETLRTWYGTGEGSSSSAYQQQISSMEDVLRTQRQEMEQLRAEIRRRDSEMDDVMCRRDSEIDDM